MIYFKFSITYFQLVLQSVKLYKVYLPSSMQVCAWCSWRPSSFTTGPWMLFFSHLLIIIVTFCRRWQCHRESSVLLERDCTFVRRIFGSICLCHVAFSVARSPRFPHFYFAVSPRCTTTDRSDLNISARIYFQSDARWFSVLPILMRSWRF